MHPYQQNVPISQGAFLLLLGGTEGTYPIPTRMTRNFSPSSVTVASEGGTVYVMMVCKPLECEGVLLNEIVAHVAISEASKKETRRQT